MRDARTSMSGVRFMSRLIDVWAVLDCSVAKYIHDIHSNMLVEDRSSGFHVFELHGFWVGMTSNIHGRGIAHMCYLPSPQTGTR